MGGKTSKGDSKVDYEEIDSEKTPEDASEKVATPKADKSDGKILTRPTLLLQGHNDRPPYPSPYLKAGYLSRLTWWWTSRLFRVGYKPGLMDEDIYDCIPDDKAERLVTDLQRKWEERNKKGLLHTMMLVHRPELLMCAFATILAETIRIVQPFLITDIIEYIQGRRDIKGWQGGLYAATLVLLSFIFTIPNNYQLHWMIVLGSRMRAACSSLIYRKTLKLSNRALADMKSGHIQTLMSVDVEQMWLGLMFLQYLWIAPILPIVVITLLYVEFGIAALGAFLFIFILLLSQGWLATYIRKLRFKVAKWTDKRIQQMNSILGGMNAIKIYCWEEPLKAKIAQIRNNESAQILMNTIVKFVSTTFGFLSSKILTYVVILIYALQGNIFTITQVFKLVAWVEVIRMVVFQYMPLGVQFFMIMMSSSSRIETFLLCEEKGSESEKESNLNEAPPLGPDEALKVGIATASWHQAANHDDDADIGKVGTYGSFKDAEADKLNQTFRLSDIEFDVRKGDLVAIVGSTGSGKTSLLLAIMEELPLESGIIQKNGEISYCSQQGWIFSGSIQDNVLFGEPMDHAKYQDVIRCCSLNRDIEAMVDGDKTLVGQKGQSLSGGQKSRIALARAVYRERDIYLLDGPLSSVDTKVGKQMFHSCIYGYLSDKTRLVVTHQLQFLKHCDKVLVMNEGKLLAYGTYEELKTKVNFDTIMGRRRSLRQRRRSSSPYTSDSDGDISGKSDNESDTEGKPKPETGEEGEEDEEESFDESIESSEGPKEVQEDRKYGSVGMATYWQYFSYGKGLIFVPLIILFNLIVQVFYIIADVYITEWAEQLRLEYGNETYIYTPEVEDLVDWEGIYYVIHTHAVGYSILMGMLVLTSIIRAIISAYQAYLSSTNLHDTMFGRVIRAPMSFFQTTPQGILLNRFTRDTSFMDELVPQSLYFTAGMYSMLISIIVFTCIANPLSMIFLLPSVIALYALVYYGIKTTRDMRRLEAARRSPVFGVLSTSIDGLHVVRSMKMESRLVERFEEHLDKHTAAWIMFQHSLRWLGVRFDWINAFYIFGFVTVSMVMPKQDVNEDLVGLALTYIVALIGLVNACARSLAELESQMTSVERVLAYTTLPQEADEHTDVLPAPSWPAKGEIVFDHVTLYYDEDKPPALNNVFFRIEGGEKIGIVGRTGAGKSTLLSVIMRLSEPQGSLWIDEVDVTKMGLTDLRSNISVIPQHPYLFIGSLRVNLDPFEEYSDSDIWTALEQVRLKDKVESLPGGLDNDIGEGGCNFSVGQKQLLCLARAILRANRILLIDEATAHVDQATDSLIQKAIRENFTKCSVLTIAHRLNTILDSDRILVLDAGEIQEFDHAHILLQNSNSHFSQMVEQSGTEAAQRIKSLAHSYYRDKLERGGVA